MTGAAQVIHINFIKRLASFLPALGASAIRMARRITSATPVSHNPPPVLLLEPFGLAKVPHPAKLPDIAINVFWHAKYHREPANRWLRGVVFELFGDGKAAPPRRVGSNRMAVA